MQGGHLLTTQRLRLVPCDQTHFEGLHALNSDPVVMQYIGTHETREQTQAMIDRVQARWAKWGYSWWSFLERDSDQVIGAGCIQNLRHSGAEPDPDCPLEIGWRLRQDRWHRGLATEAAVAMAEYAFDVLSAPTLYAVCHLGNEASSAVMKRLHMRYRGIEQWYQQSLTTYEISAAQWRAARSPGYSQQT